MNAYNYFFDYFWKQTGRSVQEVFWTSEYNAGWSTAPECSHQPSSITENCRYFPPYRPNFSPQSIDPVPGFVHGGKEFLHLYMKYVRAVDKPRSEEQHQILKLARELGKGPGGDGETNSPESAFENDVRDRLSRRFQEIGLQHLDVESHVGCDGFRIDLAVRDLDSGRYILGIECDGRSYHPNASARFRDIWRLDILEKFRWKVHRVWSQNWWRDPAKEIDEIVDKVKSLTVI